MRRIRGEFAAVSRLGSPGTTLPARLRAALRRSFSFSLSWPGGMAPLALLPLATGCSSSASGTLQLVTGEEDASTTFAGVTRLDVSWVDYDAGVHPLANVAWPASTIGLGSFNEATVGMIEVSGADSADAQVLFGATIPLQFGSLNASTVPIFVQRTGAFARLPRDGGVAALGNPRPSPLLGVIDGRYVLIAGGDDTTQLYDLLTVQPLPSPPKFPTSALSMAVVNTEAFLIDPSNAYSYELGDSGSSAVTLPPGGSAADIAGGATLSAPDGTQYIVGATRPPGRGLTNAILRIDIDGTPSWITLNVSREGAAAAVLGTSGLIVIGGSASAPGAELVASGATASTSLTQVPADPSTSAVATALGTDARYVLVAGGTMPDGTDPGVRVIDLQCNGDGGCAPTSWPALPTPVLGARAFGTADPNVALVVGNEASGGATHVFRVTSQGATELPTRVAHAYANAVASPIGLLGAFFLYGGASDGGPAEIEAFEP